MKDQNVFEWNVLIALFKATMEQTAHLNGQTEREAKLIFNRWKKQGDILLRHIEQLSDEDYLEDITCKIEDSIHELRNK